MKRCLLAVFLFAAQLTATTYATDAWLLVPRAGHFTVVRATETALEDVVDVESAAPLYGEWTRKLAITSLDRSKGTPIVLIIDKESGQITRWETFGTPAEDAARGPARHMLLRELFAYYPTVHEGPRAKNAGGFDLKEISLLDGSHRTFPLPLECVGPRVGELGRVPVAYTSNGFGIWRLKLKDDDYGDAGLRPVAERAQFADLAAKETTGAPASAGPSLTIADYLLVENAGAFRISSTGTLQRILSSELMRVAQSVPTTELGAPADVLALVSGEFEGNAGVGVVRRQANRVVFDFLDARTLTSVWKVQLPRGVVAKSLYSTGDGFWYINGDTGAVAKVTRKGTEAKWRVPGRGMQSARVLTVIESTALAGDQGAE
jgi:hypothetical protein